jgi:hypothetical protein
MHLGCGHCKETLTEHGACNHLRKQSILAVTRNWVGTKMTDDVSWNHLKICRLSSSQTPITCSLSCSGPRAADDEALQRLGRQFFLCATSSTQYGTYLRARIVSTINSDQGCCRRKCPPEAIMDRGEEDRHPDLASSRLAPVVDAKN